MSDNASADDLRSRIGAVYQDFVRYQFSAAENIGLGDARHVEDREAVPGGRRVDEDQIDTRAWALPHLLQVPDRPERD